MSLIPFAEHKLIPPDRNDPRIKIRIGILHVDAGNSADLYNLFKRNQRAGGSKIEAHCHIRKDGHLFQYRDTAFQADANRDANDFAVSYETQGLGSGKWTDAQLATIKKVMLYHRDHDGIPLRQVVSWNDPQGGWGYHTLFGAPGHWTPVAKSCPGPERKRQFHEILVPWMVAQSAEEPKPEEDDVKPTPLTFKTPMPSNTSRAHYDPKVGDSFWSLKQTSRKGLGPGGVRAQDVNVQGVLLTVDEAKVLVACALHWKTLGQNGITHFIKNGERQAFTASQLKWTVQKFVDGHGGDVPALHLLQRKMPDGTWETVHTLYEMAKRAKKLRVAMTPEIKDKRFGILGNMTRVVRNFEHLNYIFWPMMLLKMPGVQAVVLAVRQCGRQIAVILGEQQSRAKDPSLFRGWQAVPSYVWAATAAGRKAANATLKKRKEALS